jgi:hypothetical protein
LANLEFVDSFFWIEFCPYKGKIEKHLQNDFRGYLHRILDMRIIRYFFALLVLVGCTNQSVSEIEKKLNGKYCSNTTEENPLVLFSDNTYSLGYVEMGRWEINDYGDFTILTLNHKNKRKEGVVLFKENYYFKFNKSVFPATSETLFKICD